MKDDMDILENNDLLDILKNNNSSNTSDSFGVRNDEGSGDLDLDLKNWFFGQDKTPSSPLGDFVSNATLKVEYGMKNSTLGNFKLMGDVRKYLEDACSSVFDTNLLLTMESDEVNNRVKLALEVYKSLYTMNQRSYETMKDLKMKGEDPDELDSMKILLSSVPSDKLKDILKAMNEKENK